MAESPRIYLDNAATSWPKPDSVVEAIRNFYSNLGSAAGRGMSYGSTQSSTLVNDARVAVASLLNVKQIEQIVFTSNGTDALNRAIHGVVEPGDHIVATEVEHNSVLRPLNFLREHRNNKFDLAKCNPNGVIDVDHLESLVNDDTKLVCVSHVSNVTGLVQPVHRISQLCREKDILLLVDAAQSLGHLVVDVEELGCDLLAAPGHKGLLGPLGTGLLFVGERALPKLKPLQQGGTGTESELESQPWQMPTRLENGNLNVGGLAGLTAGIEFVMTRGLSSIEKNLQATRKALLETLSDAGAEIYGAEGIGPLSFNLSDVDPHTVAGMLESSFNIQVRAGLHCSPRMHKALGTFDYGGTVRLSPGVFTTIDELGTFAEAIEQINQLNGSASG